MTAQLHFLAYVRQGLAAGGTTPDPISTDIPARQPVTVGVRLAGRADERTFDVRLYGPGDVRGIDERQVIRVEPAPGARDFEPTNLVTVEFDRPDFPWLFTPAAPGSRQRLRPWLFLVVVPVERATLRTDVGPLPVLECDRADLPSLADSWAWAHAQVATVDGAEGVADVLAGDPARTLSRLISPTRLAADTTYRACLVPAFEPGRLAGLGLAPAEDAGYAPAWRPGTGEAPPLPVYHSWEFTTGPAGDFRSLVARLQPRAAGLDVGLRPVRLGPAGVPELDPGVPTVTLGFEGALRGALTMPSHWPAPSREAFAELLRGLITDTTTTLGPPLYGGRYAGASRIPGDAELPHWLRELNLDPRHRAAAALGTRVIRERQERLMVAAWEQAAEVQRANELLRQTQLAAEVSRSMYERHVAGGATAAARAAAAAGSPAVGRLLQLSGAVLDAVTVSPRGKRLVGSELHRNPTAAATLSAPFRRIARPGGPVARRAGTELDSVVAAAAANEVAAVAPPHPPAGTVLFDDVAGDNIAFHLINQTRFDNAVPWWREPAAAGLAAPARTTAPDLDLDPDPDTDEPVADQPVADQSMAAAVAGAEPAADPATQFQVIKMRRRDDPNDPWPWPDPEPEPEPEPEPAPEPLPVPHPDTSPLPAGVASTPTGAAGMVLSPPSQAVGGARVFVNTTDGRLFERHNDGGGWVWLDRGAPPGGGGAAAVEPGGVFDGGKRLFLANAFGHLFEHYWEGDRWLWRQHPWPPYSYGLGTAPALVLNNQSLFVSTTLNGTANVGRLWERRREGDQWTWWDHGNPGDGERIITNPGAAHGNTRFFVGTDTGALWERQWNGTRWLWVAHGKPPGTTVADLGPAWGTNSLFVKGRNGNLFERYHDGTRWNWRDHGPPPGSQIVNMGYGILSLSGEDSLFVSGIDGSLYQRRYANSTWTWHNLGRPPGDNVRVMQPPSGVMNNRFTAFVSGSNGHLYGIRRSGASWVWDDHGVPLDSRGSGPVTAEPAADPRWALPLGFLSNLVAAHVDNAAGPNNIYHRIGRDLGFEAEVRGGWSDPIHKPGTIGAETQGLGIAVADVTGDGDSDLIVMWVDNPSGANALYYQIGYKLGASGAVTGDWGPVRRLPDDVAAEVQGADLAVADLDGDGRPELILAYVTGGTSPMLYYRIGWRLDTQGQVTGGWSDSIPVPGWTPRPVRGVGVAVADLNDDLIPEIVLLTIEPLGGVSQAMYRIGWRLNARGRVVGGWAPVKEVGGGRLLADQHGAGIAVMDVTGTRRADLVMFHVANPLAGYNTGWYRVGWDLDRYGIAERWSADAPVTGWFGVSGQGAAIAVADIDPALLAVRTQMGDQFTAAARRHQDRVLAAQRLVSSPVRPVVDAAALATRVTAALAPTAGIAKRVTDRLALPGDGTAPAALHQLVVVPHFPEPMYEAVRELSQELLFPGASQIPPDTLTLLRVNSTFVESFMVGLNSELAREMLWRRYPTDPRATFFRQFWDARSGEPAVGPLTDLPPIANWSPEHQLGENATAVGAGDLLVVLIRGELLRRYPGTELYVQRAVLDNGVRTLGDEVREPQFTGSLEPDLRFFGLPLSVSDARGDGDDPGWFVVLRQPPVDSRFAAETASGGEPYNSAHHARALLRRPVMVAVHASDMVPPIDDTWQVDATVAHDGGVPQHRIVALAGTRSDGTPWRMSTEEVIEAIGRHERFLVERPIGDRVRVRVSRTGAGRPYLTTEADGDLPNNLLSLPRLAEDSR